MTTHRPPPDAAEGKPISIDPSADPEEVRRLVGLEIVRRRLELELRQEDLAERSSVSTQYLSKIENGHVDVSLAILRQIARGLRCHVAHLFGPEPTLSAKALDLAKDFDRAPEEIQGAIIEILHGVTKAKKPDPEE